MSMKAERWWAHLQMSQPDFHVAAATENLEGLNREGTSGNRRVFRIDLTHVLDKDHLLDSLRSRLGFPDSFGQNWDALADMAGDLSWWPSDRYFALLLENPLPLASSSPEIFGQLLEALAGAADRIKKSGRAMFVVIGGGSVLKPQIEVAVGVLRSCDHRDEPP